MNQFDDLIAQIDSLSIKLEEQAFLLDQHLTKLQVSVVQLQRQLGIYGVMDEPKEH